MSDYTPTTGVVRAMVMAAPMLAPPDELGEQFDRWLAGERAQVLRDAADLARRHWTSTTNLPDPHDPDAAYSFDVWLDVLAERIERNSE